MLHYCGNAMETLPRYRVNTTKTGMKMQQILRFCPKSFCVNAMKMLLRYCVNTTKTSVKKQQKFAYLPEAFPCKRSLSSFACWLSLSIYFQFEPGYIPLPNVIRIFKLIGKYKRPLSGILLLAGVLQLSYAVYCITLIQTKYLKALWQLLKKLVRKVE